MRQVQDQEPQPVQKPGQEPVRSLPAKIEARLTELLKMKEFDMGEVQWCRATYWGARDDWHKILVACNAVALARNTTNKEKA
ncbi:MAG: hypothetical protein JWP34_5298 [Massilia sp.]|nr:hypothetical protein [Massilia sp.]